MEAITRLVKARRVMSSERAKKVTPPKRSLRFVRGLCGCDCVCCACGCGCVWGSVDPGMDPCWDCAGDVFFESVVGLGLGPRLKKESSMVLSRGVFGGVVSG